jgi:hypothetical protein
MRKVLLNLLGMMLLANLSFAHINPDNKPQRPSNPNNEVSFRNDCESARSQRDQAINNVRARLTTGGDVWWDGSNGRYVVPKVPPGVPEVSSIFAGAVWLGGVDEGGNLKLAAQTYGRPNSFDFWSGPLTPLTDPTPGITFKDRCAEWDKFFIVTGEEIDEHRQLYDQSINTGELYDQSQIPSGVRGWPGKGNPFFAEVHGFDLPEAEGLAGFFDFDGDGFYNPLNGDYPIIEIRGCDIPQYPDEMIFWIYNDNGNIHAQSQGDPIQMEVQVQAFAYATNDQLNDMTFQRYKLINRAIEPIDSAFFAMWVDPDLGCYTDDYVGCDVERALGYVYNEDALDGQTGCTCPQGVNTYCDEVPILGVDYFRGPLGPKKFGPGGELVNPGIGEQADTIVELGMSSFTYYNNGGVGTFPPGTTDPNNAQEYYNYLTGSWRDGRPFEFGGDGYDEGTFPINYAFPEAPDDNNGWSMCTGGEGGEQVATGGDRRTIQASGPFRLDPGAVNELIIGVVWVPEQNYPCPSIRSLTEADDLSQALFNNCFDITDGPDAPDIDIIELDQELILILTNDTVLTASNNAFEAYEEVGLEIPPTATDSFYRFEGYKIYQIAGPEIGLTPDNVEDPTRVRLIAQVDIQNNVGRLFNWATVPGEENPTGEEYYIPELQVDGQDRGILHTFRVTEDVFAEGDRRLINHKKYYFAAVAYAYNEYEAFDPEAITGQRRPYLEGRRNIGANGDGLPYTAIPRPITDRVVNASYGDGAVITRLDGVGTGKTFLDLSEETKAGVEAAFANNEPFTGDLTYAGGAGPVTVQIFNPLDVVDGDYELRFVDGNLEDDELEEGARWELRDLSNPDFVIASERTIEQLNEQIIKQFGFSVSVGQVPEPGSRVDESNGFIGFDIVEADPAAGWFDYVPEGTNIAEFVFDDFMFDYLSTSPGEKDDALDPDGGLSQFGDFAFMPYYLLDFSSRGEFDFPFLGPVWAETSASGIVRNQIKPQDLNNVDIVFTSDKSLWSRCAIVETANRFYEDIPGIEPEPYIFGDNEEYARQFDLRPEPSVGKEADADGLPIPDGAVDADGNPLYGMGWFPGYAIDVETGQRLNIFFGENSIYNGDTLANTFAEGLTGGDMMFNPTSEITNGLDANFPFSYVFGCQHYVYVTSTAYDECEAIRDALRRDNANYPLLRKVPGMSKLSWAGAVVMKEGTRMNSYADGLIPTETTVKLRVNNSYQVELDDGEDENGDQRTGSGENNYHPLYQFSIEGRQAGDLDEAGVENALDLINVVPNPYYGFSDYETSQFTNIIKITNLPPKCVVTIYTLEGKFIRQYTRDEVPPVPDGTNRGIERGQINPALEWDLNNSKGIPVASGVYLIHVAAEGLGERTLKWFGVGREFDPSGL